MAVKNLFQPGDTVFVSDPNYTRPDRHPFIATVVDVGKHLLTMETQDSNTIDVSKKLVRKIKIDR